jgi:DNA processing protein
VTEREALVALNMVAGMGAVTARRLAERAGSFAAALCAPEAEMLEVQGVGPGKAREFAEAFAAADPAPEMARAERLRVRLVTLADAEYPAMLKETAEPPLVLYVRGDAGVLGRPCVAVVGTRHPTVYGRETAKRFGFQLAAAGYTVVSGLAAGIDTEAHSGAVASGGVTAGIVGGALDRFYPRENEALAKAMVEHGGAVLSEYPFGRAPDRQTFPMRNRIVSGLCKGVVVVEAPFGSGTLITAKWALEQGRAVMAVPGRIDSPASQGSLRLLREGARLVTSADEVAEELQELVCPAPRRGSSGVREGAAGAPAAKPAPVLGDEERRVLAMLTVDGILPDDVARALGIPVGRASSILMGLQIRHLAKALPGGRVAPAQ